MTAYVLSYEITPEMQRRAMVSWMKPERSRAQKLRGIVLGVLAYIAIVGATVALMQFDLFGADVVIAAGVGFLGGLALWVVTYRSHAGKITGFADDALARHGPLRSEFSADEVQITSRIATSKLAWACFDAVIPLADATVLRAGATVYPLPDAALPAGTPPEAFRQDITNWIEAAR